MLVDYHVHSLGHDDFSHTVEEVARFFETARQRGVTELGIADHDRYYHLFKFHILEEVQQMYPDVRLKKGVEIDYHPGEEEKWAKFIARLGDLDFVIGSVHDIGTWNFDSQDNIAEFEKWDADELYLAYFEIVQQAVKSRMFSTIGHLDLIKIFGHRSRTPVEKLIDPTLRLLAEYQQTIEVNTAGRYKRVGEIYPARGILEKCFQYGVPVTTSSDAHVPEVVGRDVAEATQMLKDIGYRQVATFEQRKRVMVPIE